MNNLRTSNDRRSVTKAVRQPGAGLSLFWDFVLPLGITGVPAAIWRMMGWLIGGFDKPGVELPTGIVIGMIVLQTAGIVSLAFVALARRDMAMAALRDILSEGPAEWRSLCLALGIICVTLFDVLANIASAYAGAGFLLLIAVPLYLCYLLFVRLSFLGVGRPR